MSSLTARCAATLIPAPHVWPTGPAAGVYVARSQDAINALLQRYDEATDGALVYAEVAGHHREGSIDLGKEGLWSKGMDRVPSGTLIVVGPIELNQESWSNARTRLVRTCLLARLSGHRIAVLVETISFSFWEDLALLVAPSGSESEENLKMFFGVVSDDGDLRRQDLFTSPRGIAITGPSLATTESIHNPWVLGTLKSAVSQKNSGLLLLGVDRSDDPYWTTALVGAAVALTEHAGPAIRILGPERTRSVNNFLAVSKGIRHLPFAPSIESAYAMGYRRMIYPAGHTSASVLLKHCPDVLLISCCVGSEVGRIFVDTTGNGFFYSAHELLQHVVAILGVIPADGKSGVVSVSDLFVMRDFNLGASKQLGDVLDFLKDNRAITWEDEFSHLVEAGKISKSSDLQKLLDGRLAIKEGSRGAAGDRL